MATRWLRPAVVAIALLGCMTSRQTSADRTSLAASLSTRTNEINDGQVATVIAHAKPHFATDEEKLLTWSSRRDQIEPANNTSDAYTHSSDAFLLVGAKTSVVHGFARRQAIRQTWASAAFVPSGVKVVFLGCESDLSMHPPAKQQQLLDAIELEKRVFGDLLTSELVGCLDSFAGLPDKVKAFMHWAAATQPSLAFVMVIDDDIYLRLDRVMELLHRPSTPSSRFFAGNSATSEYRGLAAPMRDPRHKYYISADAYPMATLPPFLTGAHFILSSDLVRFISKNFADLRGLGGIDDATVGLWLFGMLQIKQRYFDEFHVLRKTKSCSDDVISLADLTVSATRFIHENIAQGRRVCENFERAQRLKTVRTVLAPPTTTGAKSDATAIKEGDDPCFLHWDYQHDAVSNRLQIAIQLTVGAVAVGFIYVPSAKPAEDGFCGQAVLILHEKLYLTVGRELCAYHSHLLLSALDRDVQAKPSFGPVLAIARHNLRRLQLCEEADNVAFVAANQTRTTYTPVKRPYVTAVLSANAHSFRVIVECLLVELNPHQQVIVLTHEEASRVRTRMDLYVVSTFDGSEAATEALAQGGIVLLAEESSSRVLPRSTTSSRLVVLTAHHQSLDKEVKTLDILPASRVFAYTIQFTPTQLLRPLEDQDDTSISRASALFYFEHQAEQTEASELLHAIQAAVPARIITMWTGCVGGRPAHDGLCLDRAVETLQGAKFVVVSHPPYALHERDHVSDQFVMAFLAGAIPVYVDAAASQTVVSHQLFNPCAFIDCRSFTSVRECATHVSQVHASPTLYSQLRREAPITDLRQFEEVFSWHPEVSGAMASPENSTGAVRMSERLRSLLDSSLQDVR